MPKEKNVKETIKISGDRLVKKVKELVKEGNVRKITIKNKKGKTLAAFPLTAGVVGIVFAPVLAAIGGIAAVMGEGSIEIERRK